MKRNRLLMGMFCALAAVVLLESTALAQREGRRGRGGFGLQGQGLSIVRVAANPAVQKELGLDAEKSKQLSEIGQGYQGELRTAMQGLGFSREAFEGLSAEERREKMREMADKRQEATRKLDEQYTAKLAEALQPQQMERLQQIAWQAAGAEALADPKLVAALGLSKEQQDQLAAIRRDFAQQTREAFRGDDSADREARFAKIREFQDQRDAKLLAVLTSEQQDKYKELQGEPFDVSQLRGRFGQGGRGPRGSRT
jgi:hypothetical protein